MASLFICSQSGLNLSLKLLHSITVKGSTVLGLVLVQIARMSDSR